MSAIKGIIRGGQIIVNGPVDLPDETEVEVVPVGSMGPSGEGDTMGPDDIARTLAAMERVEPFEMMDDEWAAIEADRLARREWEKAGFDDHSDRLRSVWE